MKNSAKFLLVTATLLGLSPTAGPTLVGGQQRQAATPKPTVGSSPELAAVRTEIKNLRGQLTELEGRLKKAETAALRLRFDVSDLKSRNLSVSLDPAVPKKFQRLDSNSGFFVISLQNAEPYLDGFRVTLHIGNLTAARYVGFKLSTTWGPRFDWDKFTEDTYKKWESQKQTREFSYTETLIPATWNRVDLILPGTAATQLGFIDVSIDTDIVSMSGG